MIGRHIATTNAKILVTVLNLEIVKIDAEKNLIAIKGAVPGARGGIVVIRNSVKA